MQTNTLVKYYFPLKQGEPLEKIYTPITVDTLSVQLRQIAFNLSFFGSGPCLPSMAMSICGLPGSGTDYELTITHYSDDDDDEVPRGGVTGCDEITIGTLAHCLSQIPRYMTDCLGVTLNMRDCFKTLECSYDNWLEPMIRYIHGMSSTHGILSPVTRTYVDFWGQ